MKIVVKNNSLSNKKIGHVRLLPGANKVDSAEWAELAKKHPIVNDWLEDEVLEVVNMGKSEATGSPADASDLSGLNAKKAVKLVSETVQLSLLEEWKAKESRAAVLEAIAKQIERLTSTDEEK